MGIPRPSIKIGGRRVWERDITMIQELTLCKGGGVIRERKGTRDIKRGKLWNLPSVQSFCFFSLFYLGPTPEIQFQLFFFVWEGIWFRKLTSEQKEAEIYFQLSDTITHKGEWKQLIKIEHGECRNHKLPPKKPCG